MKKVLAEGYLEFCIPILISLGNIKENQLIANIVCYVFCILFSFPIFIMGFICKNIDKIEEAKFKRHYGFLYKDLRTNCKMRASQIPIF